MLCLCVDDEEDYSRAGDTIIGCKEGRKADMWPLLALPALHSFKITLQTQFSWLSCFNVLLGFEKLLPCQFV